MELIVGLLLAGAALLFLEAILPGLISGILGMGCLFAAVFVAYTQFGIRTGNVTLLVVAVGLLVGTVLWFRFFPSSRVANLFISRSAIGDVGAERADLLGQTGVAVSTLRPSGIALFDGKRIDVVTEGAMVERGAPVKVVAIEGMRIVVRAV